MPNHLREIADLGQAVWLDNISRQLVEDGGLERLIAEDGLTGVTSNPTIFEKAIGGSDRYDDALGSVETAKVLRERIDRPNVLIKVPGTAAGVTAFEELTAAGVPVNVTLLFAVGRYEEVAEAYVAGLERRLDAG